MSTTTARQFVIDAGWDFGAIEATAAKGVADADIETCAAVGLNPADLLAYCRERVAREVRS